jgi:hypothetical protein
MTGGTVWDAPGGQPHSHESTSVWQLTASFETKYRSMRSMMLRMLASFHVDS